MIERRYSSVDVCKIAGVPRTTLFRWEREKHLPLVLRDSRGERVYTDAHLKAIAFRKLRERYEQLMMLDSDPSSLAATHFEITMLKLRLRDDTAIEELRHMGPIDERAAREILHVALETYSPASIRFRRIAEIVLSIVKRDRDLLRSRPE